MADSATGNISVFCKLTDRHRHLSKHDNRSTLSFQLPNSQTLMIQNGAQKRVYEFNKVFDIDSTIMDINKQLKGPICNLQHGVNLCIMAYGQTGSGKTVNESWNA